MSAGITLELTPRLESSLVTVTGELDLPGYAFLRDGLLKIAADDPPGLVADINALVISELSPAAVFPLVARRIAAWPGIPFSLVTHQPTHLRIFRRYGTDRYVPVHAAVEAAERHQSVPVRRLAERSLPRAANATDLARTFVRELATRWEVPELVDDGTLVVAELVRNALQHTSGAPRLRLDLRRGLLTIAVADDSTRPAVLRVRPDLTEPGLGLRIVAEAAQAWGSNRRWSGGKVVWAVLTTAHHRHDPGEPPEPEQG
jgi:anti-sigma regulatory factor (Ser/Thr protein kinase)